MYDDLYHAKRREMIGGFFQVMLFASETAVDGERHAYINSTLAVDAIEHLLAAIIESSPYIKNPQRHSCDYGNVRKATATRD